MPQRLLYLIKIFLVVSLLGSVLSGCGGQSVSETYPLESVNKSGSQTSYLYRAADQTVPETARLLTEQRKPEQISKEDPERMFLVYPEEWYHLQRDPQKPDDTLIEVDNKEYVRQNYNPSFLQGYLLASVLNNLFDALSGRQYGNYRGYTSKDVYQPQGQYHTPSVSERKAVPPITVQKTGSIFKRGQKTPSVTVGEDGNPFKRSADNPENSASKGKITKGSGGNSSFDNGMQPKSGSSFSPPKRSPPKIKVGGSGRITRRR